MKPYETIRNHTGRMEDSMDPFIVARAIKNLRKDKGYSLNRLAELSGLSKGYLSKIENGINAPTITTMARRSVQRVR